MAASQNMDTQPKAPAGSPASPPQKAGKRPVLRWVVRGLLLVGLAVGLFGVLPRLGGLARDTAELRHARRLSVAAAIVAQAISLASYALLYRRVLASLGARLRFVLAMRVTLASFLVSHVTPFGSAAGTLLNVSTLGNRGRRRIRRRRGDRADQPGVHDCPAGPVFGHLVLALIAVAAGVVAIVPLP